MKNVVTRTMSGTIFVAIIVAAILYRPATFVIVFSIISAVCTWEFCTLVNSRTHISTNRMICSVATVYLFLSVMAFVTEMVSAVVFIPYFITTIYLLISELYLGHEKPVESWAMAFASQLYIALPLSMINVLAFINDPYSGKLTYTATLPLALMIFVWINDIGAYCFGSTLQKYFPLKLFPSVSPHKSWIGSIGGGVLTLASALVIAYFCPNLTTLQWLGMALVVVVFGTWGDLVESQLKRCLGVKDSGNFLPGHGGALDRFDSTLIAIPAVVLYLYTLQIV